MSSGIYVPGKDGRFDFKEAKTAEERPILSFEEDTGRILLNFNLILAPKFRKLQDIIVVGHEGVTQGLILTSTAIGPEERAAIEKTIREAKV